MDYYINWGLCNLPTFKPPFLDQQNCTLRNTLLSLTDSKPYNKTGKQKERLRCKITISDDLPPDCFYGIIVIIIFIFQNKELQSTMITISIRQPKNRMINKAGCLWLQLRYGTLIIQWTKQKNYSKGVILTGPGSVWFCLVRNRSDFYSSGSAHSKRVYGSVCDQSEPSSRTGSFRFNMVERVCMRRSGQKNNRHKICKIIINN